MASIQEHQPKIAINKRQEQNQCFDEALTEKLSFRMMLIPSSRFLMGSPEDELGRTEAESPQHEVNVGSFSMAEYPVTQAQWRLVAEMPQVNRELKLDPAHFKGDKRPVESVSWYEAVEFCDRLSQKTKRGYRLPTEAEWEYACRATTETPFHFGETITTDLVNYRGTGEYGSYGPGLKGKYREETTAVDYFGIANAFGLCDMHGNVFEWCQDHWHDNYNKASTDGSTWLNENEKARHVVRGGSWLDFPGLCRSAARVSYVPDVRSSNVGFRVVGRAPYGGGPDSVLSRHNSAFGNDS
ncbi:MAG: formylglycine-generating enzyme family protein [Leptolyngbyaceae cyanobacterium MO_188.B28]|nr:formylglycine-generating enzyme family protein [Leptolyngbyaceae cyanobacterium MO_188.B28]